MQMLPYLISLVIDLPCIALAALDPQLAIDSLAVTQISLSERW
jgi:hypothetical protein